MVGKSKASRVCISISTRCYSVMTRHWTPHSERVYVTSDVFVTSGLYLQPAAPCRRALRKLHQSQYRGRARVMFMSGYHTHEHISERGGAALVTHSGFAPFFTPNFLSCLGSVFLAGIVYTSLVRC